MNEYVRTRSRLRLVLLMSESKEMIFQFVSLGILLRHVYCVISFVCVLVGISGRLESSHYERFVYMSCESI